jgi:AcrR family transcriptional regulator
VISQSLIADKQRAILNAALTLFVEYGFHATPTSKIASAAGVANGTLFHYYSTKDELIIALYVDIKTRMAGCMMADDVAHLPLKDQCQSFFVSALQWGLQHQSEFRFVQQFSSSPYLLMLAPEEIQKQSRKIIELISFGIQSEVLKNLPPDFLLTLLSVSFTESTSILSPPSPTPILKTNLYSILLKWSGQ